MTRGKCREKISRDGEGCTMGALVLGNTLPSLSVRAAYNKQVLF